MTVASPHADRLLLGLTHRFLFSAELALSTDTDILA